MTMANAAESGLMKLTFQAIAWANYADNAASSPETNIVVALATADPGEAGVGNTSETTYTSYARVNVARTSGGFAESGGVITPVSSITFPAGTGGSGTVTFASFGKSGGGASALICSGAVAPNIVTGNGVTPILTTATSITLD